MAGQTAGVWVAWLESGGEGKGEVEAAMKGEAELEEEMCPWLRPGEKSTSGRAVWTFWAV